MDPIIKSEWFFFISSIGFIILGTLAAILLIYIIRAIHIFSSLIKKMESEIGNLGSATQEFLVDIRNSFVFRMIFGSRRKRTSLANNKLDEK